jgi:hypothetical protein
LITDTLRPPPLLDLTADAYKDWLHLNIFDHATGCVGLFNTSLHGSPREARSRAMGTALVHDPERGWFGNLEVGALRDANVGATSIALEKVAVATDGGTVLASAVLPAAGLHAGITATPRSRAIDIEQPLPFGKGWISWFVVPRLDVRGGLALGDRRIDLSRAIAYHDHNWGRWHWGDDVGWEWGACLAAEPAVTIVVSRATDRAHGIITGALLVLEVGAERRRFPDANFSIRFDGRTDARPVRLPGALAALHQDRISPPLPATILVEADDGIDTATLEFRVRASAQLIAGDPSRRGYGFLHQLVGGFTASGRIDGRAWDAEGLGIFEYVD